MPSNRRPGFSRRAQYGLFFGYVTAVSGAVVALLLLVLSAVDPNGFGVLKGAVSDATLPVTSAGRSVVEGVTEIAGDIGSYINAASNVRRLEAEAKASQTKLIEARAATFENARSSGAEVLQEPMDQGWGPRDCAFRDPSGNTVRISQAPAA